MILTGNKIIKEVENGNIIIDELRQDNISTNSYDLSIGNVLLKYNTDLIEPKKQNSFEEIIIPEEGYLLEKGTFHLGSSVETIGSTKYVPIIHGKSGTARLGLFVHITADLIDIGYVGKTTFQLFATMPIMIYPNMKIAQVTFWNVDGDITLYEGKYQGGQGPQVSKTYLDF